jgi:hypothetical protein
MHSAVSSCGRCTLDENVGRSGGPTNHTPAHASSGRTARRARSASPPHRGFTVVGRVASPTMLAIARPAVARPAAVKQGKSSNYGSGAVAK